MKKLSFKTKLSKLYSIGSKYLNLTSGQGPEILNANYAFDINVLSLYKQ